MILIHNGILSNLGIKKRRTAGKLPEKPSDLEYNFFQNP